MFIFFNFYFNHDHSPPPPAHQHSPPKPLVLTHLSEDDMQPLELTFKSQQLSIDPLVTSQAESKDEEVMSSQTFSDQPLCSIVKKR